MPNAARLGDAGAGNPPGFPVAAGPALWPPSAEPIAHGLPTSSGRAFERVVGALAVDAPDRLDGRKVQHVEPHFGHVRQPRLDVSKAPVARGAGAAERGNNSYQLLKPARLRSATSSSVDGRGAAAIRVAPRTCMARAGSSASAFSEAASAAPIITGGGFASISEAQLTRLAASPPCGASGRFGDEAHCPPAARLECR